jgi:hypothetical protein
MPVIPHWIPLALCAIFAVPSYLASRQPDGPKSGVLVGLTGRASLESMGVLIIPALLQSLVPDFMPDVSFLLFGVGSFLLFSFRLPRELSFWPHRRTRNIILVFFIALFIFQFVIVADRQWILVFETMVMWSLSTFYNNKAVRCLVHDLDSTRFKILSQYSLRRNHELTTNDLRRAS